MTIALQLSSVYQEREYSLRRWLDNKEDPISFGYSRSAPETIGIPDEELESWMEQHTATVATTNVCALPGKVEQAHDDTLRFSVGGQ
jgi:hypothetical protein